MSPTVLRQLARDHFEGRLDRDAYRHRRRELIDAWVAGGELQDPGGTPTQPNPFSMEVGLPADSAALADAFANREGSGEPADGGLPGAVAVGDPDAPLVPDFSRTADAEIPADGGEAGTVADPPGRPASRAVLWIGVTVVVLLGLALWWWL